MDRELAAGGLGTLDDNPAAVCPDDSLHEAEAQSRSLHLCGNDVGGAIEGLEDSFLIARRFRSRDR